jgi:hypothetical protein
MLAKKKTGMFDKESIKLGSVDEVDQESISILNSEGDIEVETEKEKQNKIKLVEEPKMFRNVKGQELVKDAKGMNSIKRTAAVD